MSLQGLDPAMLTLAKVALTLMGAALLLALTRRMLTRAARAGHLSPSMGHRLRVVMTILYVLLAALAIFQQTGFFRDAWAVLSTFVVTLAVGFVALWSVLSNAVCALLILAFRPFRLGDEIELIEPADDKRGVRGRVSDLSLMFTTIEEGTDDGQRLLARIPNSVIFQKGVRVRIPESRDATVSFFGEPITGPRPAGGGHGQGQGQGQAGRLPPGGMLTNSDGPPRASSN